MARILTKLRIDEVSSVDRGAGKGVKVVLAKRDGAAPREGSAREKFENAIQQIRRGFPEMSMREARAQAWNSLSEEQQIELLREERQDMNKLDSSELFSDWWRQLSASERARYRRQQADIDAQLAEEERVSRAGTTTRAEVAPSTPKAATRKGDDSLYKIVKDFGLERMANHVIENGAGGITEDALAECVKLHAEATGQPVSKIWTTDTVLQKAAQVCRHASHDQLAQANLDAVRMRLRG